MSVVSVSTVSATVPMALLMTHHDPYSVLGLGKRLPLSPNDLSAVSGELLSELMEEQQRLKSVIPGRVALVAQVSPTVWCCDPLERWCA